MLCLTEMNVNKRSQYKADSDGKYKDRNNKPMPKFHIFSPKSNKQCKYMSQNKKDKRGISYPFLIGV